MENQKQEESSRKRRGRGEGSIHKRANGLWAATIDLGVDDKGKRRRKTIYGKRKKQVATRLRELQTDADNGRIADAGKITVAAYLKTWLETTARPRIVPKTYVRYQQLVKCLIAPKIGGIRLAKLAPLHIKAMFAALEKNGVAYVTKKGKPATRHVSARTIQMAGTMLHTALRDAVKEDRLIKFNPASGVSKPKPPKTKMQVWDRGQVARFLVACRSDRLYPLYALAIDSGARQGELFGLRWQDIDFTTGSVLLQSSLEEINGHLRLKEPKSGKGRRIELSRFAVDALLQHRKAMLAEGHARPDAPVFCDTAGGWLRKGNVLRRSFWLAIALAGLHDAEKAIQEGRQPEPLPKIRFHDLRHTTASLLLLAGVHPKVVQERLGHAKIEVTLNIYSHLLPTMQKEAAEQLNAILGA